MRGWMWAALAAAAVIAAAVWWRMRQAKPGDGTAAGSQPGDTATGVVGGSPPVVLSPFMRPKR